MYFAVLGRHPKLSLEEFALVTTTSLRRQGSFLFFETDLDKSALLQQLEKLGGIVKWGKIATSDAQLATGTMSEIEKFLQGIKLVGANDQKLGMELKRTHGIKRFKLVELTSSDLEVKKEGKEVIDLGGEKIGLVLGRQDIRHFELIDFEKPANGMEIGMMPAKLAQMMVNIGIAERAKQLKDGTKNCLTIYDPFCGFGTTGLVANWLGHHFVGSDIIIDGAKKNAKRQEKMHNEIGIMNNKDGVETHITHPLHFTIFKHDVTQSFDHPLVKKVDVIVTEGWLGPVVTKKTRETELQLHAKKIQDLYRAFLHNIHAVIPHVPIVITIPHYPRLPEAVSPDIIAYAAMLGYHTNECAIYSRKGQEVCRQVMVFSC